MSKKQRIVAAAVQRFRYYGITKTTMQEIAHDAGVAVGTLYLYFQNKDELIVACAESYAARHQQHAAEILASDAPADEKLRDYLVARFRQAEETRTGSRHAVEITRAVLRVKPDRAREEGMMMWEVTTKILVEGVKQKLFRLAEPAEEAKVFMYSLAVFFPHALVDPPVEPLEQDLLLVVNWFIDVWKSGARAKRSRPKARAGRSRRPAR